MKGVAPRSGSRRRLIGIMAAAEDMLFGSMLI